MKIRQNSTAKISGSAEGNRWGRLKRSLGYLIAIFGLIWVFHDIHIGQLFRDFHNIVWVWVIPAVIFDIMSYVCQGWRWQLVLKSIGNISVLRTTQAIYVGLFTNEVLPMRVGELVRGFLVGRWMRTGLVNAISSVAVERLFDIVWMAVAIGITTMFVPLPRDLLDAADVLGLMALGATALFIYLVFVRKARHPEEAPQQRPGKIAVFFDTTLERLSAGLRKIGISKYFYAAFAASLLIFIFQILAFWLVMWAYGLHLSLWIGAVCLLIVHIGISIPNAPSNLGSYQFFTVLGLTIFGVDKTLAAGFSLFVFVALTIPLWVLGAIAIAKSGITLTEVRAKFAGDNQQPAAREPHINAPAQDNIK